MKTIISYNDADDKKSIHLWANQLLFLGFPEGTVVTCVVRKKQVSVVVTLPIDNDHDGSEGA